MFWRVVIGALYDDDDDDDDDDYDDDNDDDDISQGNVAASLSFGGIFNYRFILNLLLSVSDCQWT